MFCYLKKNFKNQQKTYLCPAFEIVIWTEIH